MCGRFVVAGERRDLLGLFEIEVEGENLPAPSWNVRPTDRIPTVVESVKGDGQPVRRLEGARWSLTPSYSKTLQTKFPTFNARSESAAEKPFFANSVRSKRAIIPASGYYEWKTEGKTKTPYYIRPTDGMIGFAGLYSWWRDAARADDDPARWVLTATILTRDAVGALRGIHERTPVTLPNEWWDEWLDPTTEGDQSLVDAAVAASTPAVEALVMHQVAALRGDDRAELINPL
jgi:putative SOS response-associated peptidase YedK